MIQRACVAALMGYASLVAHAGQMTVGDLQAICSGKNMESQNACRFYILGAVEGVTFGTATKTASGPLCIAPDVSSTALAEAVKKLMAADLSAYPDDKSLAAVGFVAAAALKAFPCRKPN